MSARRLSGAPDLCAAEILAADLLADLVEADEAHCTFFDPTSGELWSASPDAGPDRPADRGIEGWVARTGGSIIAAVARQEPHWSLGLDGRGDDRILAVAIAATGGGVDAILVATRRSRRRPFDDEDLATAEALARHAGPILETLGAQAAERDATAHDGDALFRREAVDAQARATWGEWVRAAPRWLRWVRAGLLAATLAGLVVLTMGRVRTYARGPAVMRATSPTEASVIAAIPCSDRCHLVRGQRLRVSLRGAPSQAVAIDDVTIVTAAEARMLIGEVAGAERLVGRVAVVRARTMSIADGMTGTAELEVGSQRIVEALLLGAGGR